MIRDVEPADWDLESMYAAARGGPVSDRPLVAILVPSYRESERIAQICRMSRNAVRQALSAAGIESIVAPIAGDSLICRMRQRACHLFLCSPATHLLFWDTDIECVTPELIASMVLADRPILAGACPFKNSEGRTVHNLWDDVKPELDAQQCCEVRDAGTGFMMIKRSTLTTLQKAHPELCHWSVSMDKDRGAPLWALFDTGVVDGVYQSEDYMFCRLWQEEGGKVFVYAPARFRHWGEHGFEASFMEQHGLS